MEKKQRGGKREGAGAKKLPAEIKRSQAIKFKVNSKEKEYINKEFQELKQKLKTKANADVLIYLLDLKKNKE